MHEMVIYLNIILFVLFDHPRIKARSKSCHMDDVR